MVQLWDTTLNPKQRTLKQVSIDSVRNDRVFSMLMGDEVPPRRSAFIETMLQVCEY